MPEYCDVVRVIGEYVHPSGEVCQIYATHCEYRYDPKAMTRWRCIYCLKLKDVAYA